VGQYSEATDFYDLLYAAEKDYASEATVLKALIHETQPHAQRVLDVACGTGTHAKHLTAAGFAVDGVDLEPAFVEIAQRKCSAGTFTVGDMTTLALPQRYDAVVCLFSSIGYVRTVPRLQQTLACFASHLTPAGVVIVDPWFEPGQLDDRWISLLTGETESLKVCRMARTLIEGDLSRLEVEYLIGRAEGIERRSENHELGLFTQEQMEAAFRMADLTVVRRREVLRKRGVYIGRAAA
jgi:SAM-dependent methyltransferase